MTLNSLRVGRECAGDRIDPNLRGHLQQSGSKKSGSIFLATTLAMASLAAMCFDKAHTLSFTAFGGSVCKLHANILPITLFILCIGTGFKSYSIRGYQEVVASLSMQDFEISGQKYIANFQICGIKQESFTRFINALNEEVKDSIVEELIEVSKNPKKATDFYKFFWRYASVEAYLALYLELGKNTPQSIQEFSELSEEQKEACQKVSVDIISRWGLEVNAKESFQTPTRVARPLRRRSCSTGFLGYSHPHIDPIKV
ncbi:MAG: hypothetical protein GWP59_05970 [Chlamydiales bacterium]|nr:hypothetical protein [Chlamydiales bacterium]NCF71229.1 hypothetical protein [Chlamydiales bacterium]